MRSRRSALASAVGAIPLILLACGRSTPLPSPMARTGGHDDGGVSRATGGAPAEGGTGGSPDSGGPGDGGDGLDANPIVDLGETHDVGDAGPSGGDTGTGDAPGSGGIDATGGAPGSGGIIATGGAPASTIFPRRFVGNTDTQGVLRQDFATYWDQVTPENAGKWGAVQNGAPDVFNWGPLDAIYKYAEEHDLVFKEHAFIWHGSESSWRNTLNETTGPVAVKAWMKAFCDRYPKTRIIDVVNEPPPHTRPVYDWAIGGGTRTTWDWIANAFKWAREACPNAVLLLNDYNNLEYATEVANTISIVNAIQKLDAPIDAIGCQAHDAARVPVKTVKANLDKIVAATGLPVYITEFDIGLADEEQRRQYAEYFPMFMDHPAVKGVTLWGYLVGFTWRTDTGLVNSDGTFRPAMTWLMDFLGR